MGFPTFLLGQALFVCYQTRLLMALIWSHAISTNLEFSRLAAKIAPENDFF